MNVTKAQRSGRQTVEPQSEGIGQHWVCVACGAQQKASEEPPKACKLCVDERQYIGADGQKWTSISELVEGGSRNAIKEIEPGLTAINTEPSFGIGQRAILVKTPEGNILWDCITVLDAETIEAVKAQGGIKAIAASHPHFYSSVVEWGRAFDAPIYIHKWDQDWLTRTDGDIRPWEGDSLELFGGCTLFRLGGHFPGSAVLHLPPVDGRDAMVLSGDTIQCTKRQGYVSYMYSYPVYIPLPASTVAAIRDRVKALPDFRKIYGGWWHAYVLTRGKEAAIEGADRYLDALDGKYVKDYPEGA